MEACFFVVTYLGNRRKSRVYMRKNSFVAMALHLVMKALIELSQNSSIHRIGIFCGYFSGKSKEKSALNEEKIFLGLGNAPNSRAITELS